MAPQDSGQEGYSLPAVLDAAAAAGEQPQPSAEGGSEASAEPGPLATLFTAAPTNEGHSRRYMVLQGLLKYPIRCAGGGSRIIAPAPLMPPPTTGVGGSGSKSHAAQGPVGCAALWSKYAYAEAC